MIEIPLFKVFMSETVGPEVLKVLYSGYIGQGPKVDEFERCLSDYFRTQFLITCNSGTSALHLAYHMSLNHRPDSEIISTPITCTATNTPIVANGARIVWADVDPLTGNVNPADIERKITNRTRAIVIVHWGGNPCEIDRINQIASARGIKVIEDNAHGWGTHYKSRPTAMESDFTIYSLQAIKHVTSVDGGILICKRSDDFERGKLLRWYGIDRDMKDALDLRCELNVMEAGYKFHMNDVCATIGMENFKSLDMLVDLHRTNAAFYNSVFASSETIRVSPENIKGRSSYWLYTIHVDNRDELMARLKSDGISSSKVHARNDTHSMFRESAVYLPGAESFDKTHLCIPVGWWISREHRELIAEKVIKYAR